MRRAIPLLVASVAIVAGSAIAVGQAPRVDTQALTGPAGLCRLLPGRDVTAAARERMDKVTDSEDFCSYGGRTPGGGTPATVTLALQVGFTAEQARESEPDAKEVLISGFPALLEEPKTVLSSFREASLHLLPDGDTWYQLYVLLPRRVPIAKALRSLGEVVIARLGVTAPPGPSPTPGPTVTSLCSIITADEISTAYGGTPITIVADQPGTCVYSGEEAGDAETGLVLTLAPEAQPGVSPLDLAREQYPDAVELEVAGVPALYVGSPAADAPGTQQRATLHVFPDAVTWLLLEGSAPAAVDLQASLAGLAELAVPRLLALLAPLVPSPSPSPASIPASDLEALLQTLLTGEIQKIMFEGGFLSGDQVQAFDRFTRLLRDRGMKPEDVPAFAGEIASRAAILAVYVKGQDIGPFVKPLLTLLSISRTDTQVPEALAGRGVSVVDVQGQTGYLYPKDDVLWVVVLQDRVAVTEVFDLLP